MRLFFCGDVMPGGVLPYQEKYVGPNLQKYMADFDFRIGTLESAIGTDLPYDSVKMQARMNIIYARNEDFFRIKELGFDVVSLANNHVFDLGEEGLKNAIFHLRENGISYCGAGMDLAEASRPAVLEKDGHKIAIFAYCSHNEGHWATIPVASENKAGINPLDIKRVVSDVKKAKKQYDYVVVMPHWGNEYTPRPTEECISMAKKMIDAGADAVLGSHTHQIQPSILYHGKLICFSMGNFLFPDFYMQPPRPIWYPSSDVDLKQIPDTNDYPIPIEEPVRRVWMKISRYGEIVALTINPGRSELEHEYRYVCLSQDDLLELKDLDTTIQKRLAKEKKIAQSRLLRLGVRVWAFILKRR